MADFDFSGFGDLANFSLGGAETTGPAFGGGYSLSPQVSSGFNFNAPDMSGASGFSDLATATPQQQQAPKGIGTQIAEGVGSVTKPIAEVAKPLLPVVGLGTGAMGIAAGVQGARQSAEQQRMMRQAQKMQQQSAAATQAAAAPLTEFGRKELQAAEAGTIPPAIQARINEWKQGKLAAANDFAARSGQGDSQMLQQGE